MNPANLGVTLAHEMSHIEDINQNRLGTLGKALYATEEKALMVTLSIYDELSRKFPDCRSDVYDIMLDFWKWKNEDGPYPRHRIFTLNIDGKAQILTTRDFINKYLEPALSFHDAMKNLVHALYRKNFGNPPVNPELVKAIQKAKWAASDNYKLWRANPSGTVAPVQPQPPLPQPTQPQQPAQPPQPPQPKPELSVSVNSLTFYGQEGQYSPSSESIGIRNSSGGTLNWEVSSNVYWLSLRPASGSSTGETDYVSVDVDDSRLGVGTYRAEITVSAGSLTKTVQVKVIIEPYEIDVDVSNR